MTSDVMEDYLKTIYSLQQDVGAPVRTSTIAEHLDVTPPTVSSMLSSLEDRGLIVREKYAGAELTDAGEREALEILRHHRLIESFLTEYLDYEWSEVHDEADVLEHHISESFERRVAEALDNPTVDPHGDPIPDAELSKPVTVDTDPLSDHEAGETVVIARVRDRDVDELEYLAEVGIVPGTTVTIVDVAPIGLYSLVHEEGRVQLPASIAEATHVFSEASVEPAEEVTRS
ncbi:MAG: metal-dependent transcriptional regulator [Halobacteriota archaeon]